MTQILLVDDMIDLVEEEAKLLHDYGLDYTVKTASTSDRALQLLEQEKFDLVILDLMMPKKGGVEMLHEIKRRFGCRVLIYSAYLDNIPSPVLLREGADAVLSKPAPTDLLISTVRNLVEPDHDTTLIIVQGYQIKDIKNQVLSTVIQKVLNKTHRNVQKAAALMGVSRECLSMMMKRLRIVR